MVAGDAVATLGGDSDAAEDVATADNDADFDAERAGFRDVGGDAVGDGNVDTEALRSHQRLARGFQQNTFVDWLGSHGRS